MELFLAILAFLGISTKLSSPDANVLGLGARLLGEELAFSIVDTWLKTEFEGGRHQRRVNKIEEN